jgi:hypothetical protein
MSFDPDAIEQSKRDAREFGGLQFRHLSKEELVWRMCCARGCGYPAAMQMPQPRMSNDDLPTWRTLCSRHFIQVVFLMDAFLGDPSPATEAARFAEALGIVGDALRNWKEDVTAVFNPASSRCSRCGGGFVAETQGMFVGRRYVHTCGVTARDARSAGDRE